MSDHVYKSIKVTGSSTAGSDETVKNCLDKASQTLKGLRWFEVVDVRGSIDDDNNPTWQVTVEIGFALEN